MKKLRIRRPSDFHSHLRSPAQVGKRCFRFLVRKNCAHYRFVIVEPNTFLDKRHPTHHIETVDDVFEYKSLVEDALPQGQSRCQPLFLLKLTHRTTPTIIDKAVGCGLCIGLKMYPEGVTTGSSHGGVSKFHCRQINECLAYMEERDVPLQIHPEMPETFCLARERKFHKIIMRYAKDFPKLRIFVEHVTDQKTVAVVHHLRAGGARIFGTITGHHLKITLDNVLGQVQHHCWPCAKYPEDREALVCTAVSGQGYFLSITDSAPWKWGMKHLQKCACAGVFNPAEIAIPWLATLFEKRRMLSNLPNFWALNGEMAYDLGPDSENAITLIRKTWRVPEAYESGSGKIIPFLAGEELPWQIVE